MPAPAIRQIGPFAAVGQASATVNLNPGPAWWTAASGHYRLQVLNRPATGVPGRVSVTIVLPEPQLPQSVHGVTVDNTLSHPIDVQHSWTYPGLGCGALIQPQFSVSVLYGQAQNLAFAQVRQNPQITRPLISTAKAPRRLGDPELRHLNVAIGHATSADLICWTAAADVLFPAARPAFDDLATWTGSVVRGPDGRWFMFYTGGTNTPAGVKQR
jgi:hypothetical protein